MFGSPTKENMDEKSLDELQNMKVDHVKDLKANIQRFGIPEILK
jgi:hypothetical protein